MIRKREQTEMVIVEQTAEPVLPGKISIERQLGMPLWGEVQIVEDRACCKTHPNSRLETKIMNDRVGDRGDKVRVTICRPKKGNPHILDISLHYPPLH